MKNYGIYKYPIGLTQQFRHCGNAFRVDTYKGCSFGCKYCFSNARGGNISKEFMVADVDIISKKFDKAFSNMDREYKDITIELLRRRVPIHLGGMSDPFQPIEFDIGKTYDLIKLTNKYNYPIVISTKTSYLPKEYMDILNPDIHSFQISLISNDDTFVKNYESSSHSASDRIKFIKMLKSNGFWVGLRLQPLIDIQHALNLINDIDGYVDFITVEHLKIATDNHEVKDLFKDGLNSGTYIKPKRSRNFELNYEDKLHNIKLIKQSTNIPIGCADNDMHHISDTMNCCGLDTMNSTFNNWIKYNSMYIGKTGDEEVWYPKGSCSQCFNSECRKSGFTFKDYVDEYTYSSR